MYNQTGGVRISETTAVLLRRWALRSPGLRKQVPVVRSQLPAAQGLVGLVVVQVSHFLFVYIWAKY